MNTNEIIDQYKSEFPKYKLFGASIIEILNEQLNNNEIKIHSMTKRAKDPKSLEKKIKEPDKEYKDPLKEITDLVGVRIIAYFQSDIDKILPIIENEFEIDLDNSVDKRMTQDPDKFGYVSVHYIISFKEDRLSLSEYKKYKDLKCEIQVRTILQHAWAEIEHDIEYKSLIDIPVELRRRFSALAGLLEVADREFESLRNEQEEVIAAINYQVSLKEFNIPLNHDSLKMYFDKHKDKWKISPKQLSKLLRVLRKAKIVNLKELDTILDKSNFEKITAVILEKCNNKKSIVKERIECNMPIVYSILIEKNMAIEEIEDVFRSNLRCFDRDLLKKLININKKKK